MKGVLSKLSDWILPTALRGLVAMYQFSFGNDPWTWMAIYCLALFVFSSIYITKKQIHSTKGKFVALVIISIVTVLSCMSPFFVKLAKDAYDKKQSDYYQSKYDEPEISLTAEELESNGKKYVGKRVVVEYDRWSASWVQMAVINDWGLEIAGVTIYIDRTVELEKELSKLVSLGRLKVEIHGLVRSVENKNVTLMDVTIK